jgi:hypothetical protein
LGHGVRAMARSAGNGRTDGHLSESVSSFADLKGRSDTSIFPRHKIAIACSSTLSIDVSIGKLAYYVDAAYSLHNINPFSLIQCSIGSNYQVTSNKKNGSGVVARPRTV